MGLRGGHGRHLFRNEVEIRLPCHNKNQHTLPDDGKRKKAVEQQLISTPSYAAALKNQSRRFLLKKWTYGGCIKVALF